MDPDYVDVGSDFRLATGSNNDIAALLGIAGLPVVELPPMSIQETLNSILLGLRTDVIYNCDLEMLYKAKNKVPKRFWLQQNKPVIVRKGKDYIQPWNLITPDNMRIPCIIRDDNISKLAAHVHCVMIKGTIPTSVWQVATASDETGFPSGSHNNTYVLIALGNDLAFVSTPFRITRDRKKQTPSSSSSVSSVAASPSPMECEMPVTPPASQVPPPPIFSGGPLGVITRPSDGLFIQAFVRAKTVRWIQPPVPYHPPALTPTITVTPRHDMVNGRDNVFEVAFPLLVVTFWNIVPTDATPGATFDALSSDERGVDGPFYVMLPIDSPGTFVVKLLVEYAHDNVRAEYHIHFDNLTLLARGAAENNDDDEISRDDTADSVTSSDSLSETSDTSSHSFKDTTSPASCNLVFAHGEEPTIADDELSESPGTNTKMVPPKSPFSTLGNVSSSTDSQDTGAITPNIRCVEVQCEQERSPSTPTVETTTLSPIPISYLLSEPASIEHVITNGELVYDKPPVELGRGAFGLVLRATYNGRPVAVKKLYMLESTVDEEHRNPEEEESIRRELSREISIVRRARSTNVVELHGTTCDQHGEPTGMVMELLSPFKALHRPRTVMPQFLWSHVAIELWNALKIFEERNIIHRDLKPNNLLVAPNGHVKVADFGIMRCPSTPVYMAPENCDEQQIPSPAIDRFSYGVMLMEFLSGRNPSPGTEISAGTVVTELNRRTRDLNALRAQLAAPDGAPIVNMITRLLSNDPRERPSLTEIAAVLRARRRGDWASLPACLPGGAAVVDIRMAAVCFRHTTILCTEGSPDAAIVADISTRVIDTLDVLRAQTPRHVHFQIVAKLGLEALQNLRAHQNFPRDMVITRLRDLLPVLSGPAREETVDILLEYGIALEDHELTATGEGTSPPPYEPPAPAAPAPEPAPSPAAANADPGTATGSAGFHTASTASSAAASAIVATSAPAAAPRNVPTAEALWKEVNEWANRGGGYTASGDLTFVQRAFHYDCRMDLGLKGLIPKVTYQATVRDPQTGRSESTTNNYKSWKGAVEWGLRAHIPHLKQAGLLQ